jgi:hypothetical protein
MPSIRVDFLNWRPDAEDVGNDGLTTADNVVHEPEGYKPVHLASSGAFSTTIAASTATVLSLVSKPIGSSGDQFAAWLAATTTGPTLCVGINGATAPTTATGHPLSFSAGSTDHEIYAFDVTEYGGYISWTVEAQASDASGTSLSIAYAGYMSY